MRGERRDEMRLGRRKCETGERKGKSKHERRERQGGIWEEKYEGIKRGRKVKEEKWCWKTI